MTTTISDEALQELLAKELHRPAEVPKGLAATSTSNDFRLLFQSTKLKPCPLIQKTLGRWTIFHALLRLPIVSPKILRGPMLRLPPAASGPPHQIHLWLAQNVPWLLSRLRVRRGGNRRFVHRCGWGECHICEEKVHLSTHKSYIQRLKQEVDDPKKKPVPCDEMGLVIFNLFVLSFVC